MKVVLVRHGESEANVSDICDGDPTSGIPLTPKGFEQAKGIGEKLKYFHFDVIYVSEFLRTQQTFEAMGFDKVANIEPRLNDIKSGFEGLSPQQYLEFLASSEDPLAAKQGEGESILELQERLRNFVEELKTKLFSSVLIVTHEACIQNILYLLDKRSKEDLVVETIPVASIHEVIL